MAHQTNIPTRAWAELSLLALLWGASFLSVRIALDEIGPITSVAHRVFWAALVLWLVIAWQRLPLPKDRSVWGAFLVMGLLNNAIPFGLMAWGQLYVESGLTSILNGATAIFGALLAAIFFVDERLGVRKSIGILVGFLGLMVTVGLDNILALDPASLGQIAILAGAFSYGLASVWAKKTLSGLPPQLAAAGMLTGSSLIMVPLAFAMEGPMTLDLAPATLVAIGYYAILATALAYLLYYRVLGMVGSGNLMLVTLMIPPVAILLGAIVRNEVLAPSAYLGFGLLAVGLTIIDGRLIDRLRRAG